METFKPIIIEDLVADKDPKLASKVPKFIYRWLKRVLHLDEINEFMTEYGHLDGMQLSEAFKKLLNISFNVHGFENIPTNERILFTSNHPLGGLDGVILLKLINEKTRLTKCLVNDFLMTIKPMRNYYIPINKVGGQARDSIAKIEELYNSNDNILIFPAGLCSRKNGGKIRDLKWNKHFVQKAVQHKINVVPIYFEGRNTNFFYNLANIRKFFGIKFNIEMLYLADEMFKHRNKTFDIYFGKKISFTNFDKSKNHNEWAEEMRKITYEIPNH